MRSWKIFFLLGAMESLKCHKSTGHIQYMKGRLLGNLHPMVLELNFVYEPNVLVLNIFDLSLEHVDILAVV